MDLEGSLDFPAKGPFQVPLEKLSGYLLATSHPVGGPKARYFLSRGFSATDPARLERAILEVAQGGTVISEEATDWGTKYFVVGTIEAPDGNPMILGTVWMYDGESAPSLVTAYPARRKT